MRTSKNLSINKGFALPLIIGLIVALIIIGTIAYLQFKPKLNTQPTPSTQTQSSTPDPTANWETYTNDKLKFSLKYPVLWTVDESNSSPANNFYRIFFLSKGYDPKTGPVENSVALFVTKNKNQKFEELLTSLGYKVQSDSQKKVRIGSNEFSMFSASFAVIPSLSVFAEQETPYGIIHKDYWYVFTLAVKDKSNRKTVEVILNQVLSTFKFLD